MIKYHFDDNIGKMKKVDGIENMPISSEDKYLPTL